MTKKIKRYPKAFNTSWNKMCEEVGYCEINLPDDFKDEAYLVWKEGVKFGGETGGRIREVVCHSTTN